MDVPEGGVQCEHFWSAGGCGGHDAGRCGVTGDGGLYAYYLDAVAWCADDNPFCGFRMGPVVYNGCSMAERVGYSHGKFSSSLSGCLTCPEEAATRRVLLHLRPRRPVRRAQRMRVDREL